MIPNAKYVMHFLETINTIKHECAKAVKIFKSVQLKRCKGKLFCIIISRFNFEFRWEWQNHPLIHFLIIFHIFSSSSFSYYCNCVEGCCGSDSVKCTIPTGKRNHCKQCRYRKCFSTWIKYCWNVLETSIKRNLSRPRHPFKN